MKKLINTAFIYALAAMAAGVFYREVTRMLNYTGRTYLSLAHGHLFLLGVLFFLIVALLSKFIDFTETASFRKAFIVYNVGLVLSSRLDGSAGNGSRRHDRRDRRFRPYFMGRRVSLDPESDPFPRLIDT